MKGSSQILSGILMAFLFAGLIAGSLLLSLAESGLPMAIVGDFGETAVIDEIANYSSQIPYDTDATQNTNLPTTEAPATPTSSCPPQSGWMTVEVNAGDTLAALAKQYDISEASLREGNCLTVADPILLPGMTLNIPETTIVPSVAPTMVPITIPPTPLATSRLPTKPVMECSPPAGWVTYSVRSGDNLYSLSQEVGTTVSAIQSANCMGSSILIRTGERLYLPRYPVRSPAPTKPRQPTLPPSFPPTNTPIPTAPPAPPTATTEAPPTLTNTIPPPPTNTDPPPPTDTLAPPPSATELVVDPYP